ncbi:relaxin receptor 1 isoform X1 [Anser cygnoides]|uniref:relaxin receptor 1 isoform X1 n=2 Tax=Anser cygnoides TaxID=8845 RepID=UPI002009339E|nr:relaxin receptor 1 isoform X1 [Anser cygnoides]XP_047932127.1 relaxin receptor 1 isoform X1 [Anser cygnoides]XP_047932128.1 relaxin receptor 1 isoform X1 [Anser cygnoides]XP_047932129.1 relaxin receptor 1 isoform X1 [Anser cygnoides]XP_047932130.1 relaxin receptor 1 isoform X1 [Anser cygnoides]XP_047932131.1 relaxin receptor 1 isoform X1 [Anser cygnoides]XP_047932132.1 relaxin receptor 1 isoform X1 [Anser cygnoides]XP_047932133.1 relaxin receptor 1 isoform X1 [Anser cygnoides]
MTSDYCFYIFLLIGTKVICDSLEDHVSGGGGTCPLGYFPCGNITKCLPQQLHCNGEDDCGNHADEDNCEDNNGWSLQFDKHYAKDKYNKMKSLYAFQTKTPECLAGAVPAECVCQGLEIFCDAVKLRAVPSVSSNITMMSLQRNLLRKLSADVFKKYQDLKNLYLQNNKIRAVSKHAFKGLYNLTKLYLSNNKLTNLKPGVFEDLHKLEWLIIENNRINRISPLTFYGLKSLILLEMMNNSLARLPDKPLCQYMPRLNWLDLEGNHIHHLRNITFFSCNTLTVLVMRRNKISSLNENSFSSLQMLDELDLASNKIESLPPYIFKDLKELSQLNLSYNPIKKIQIDQFDFLTKLKSLSLEGIDIANIQRRMFRPLRNLSHIYFKKFQYCGYAPHVRSCKPNTDGISSLENLLASIIQRVFVWVVSAITCFGNIFVICMRPYIRSENKLHAISIMSLCCADCLMGIYLFVIGAFDLKYRGEYNKHAQLWMDSIHCQLVGSLAILSTEVSVLLLTYLTLEKYICIVYPFRCLKPRKCRTISILVLIWIIGFVVAFIPLSNKEFFRNYYGTNGVCFPLHSEQSESTGSQIYSVVIFLGVNLAAFIIIVFSYGSMFYSVHQTAIMATEIRNHIKKEMTLAKRFFFIVFTDALCWIPIFILKLLSLLQVEIPGTITSWVVIFILPINSALNPLLYTLTTRPFKEMIHQVWYNYRQRRSKRGKGSQKTYGPSFIWVEMWPVHEITPKLTKPVLCTDSSDASVTTQSTRLNLYM